MSKGLDKPSVLERVSGSLITESGLTALAAYAGTPLAALLPVLSNSLAAGRHTERVEKALLEINDMLERHEQAIKVLSDSQYTIINEAVLTILQTTQKEKIEYLKRAIEISIAEEVVPLSYAAQISRILRDISAEELVFLVNNFQYSRIVFDEEPANTQELQVKADSDTGILVSGLISMGLIVPGPDTWDESGRYQFSSLVGKLLAVIGT